MNIKKKIIIMIIGIVCILSITVFIRYYSLINNEYQDVEITEYSNNESGLTMFGNSLTILNKTWYSKEELKSKYNYIDDQYKDSEELCLMLEVEIQNTTKEDIDFPLYSIVLVTSGFSNGINPELYLLCNKDIGMNLTIKPDEKIKVNVPYTMFDFQFVKNEWEMIENRDFDFVEYSYPKKYIWN